MASNTTTELQDRAETISTRLEAVVESTTDAERPTSHIEQADIERELERLVAHHVPVDEAVRTVVRSAIDDAGLEQADLPTELARLAGYSRRSSVFERSMLGDIRDANQWIDVVAEVVDLWEPRSEKIAQVGLLGDESDRLKFVKWASADLPELEAGETYRFESVVTDEYQGRYSVSLNSATVIEPSEEPVVPAADGITIGGTVVDVQDGSGLIKRCPEAGCTRVLQGGRCAEHGAVEGEFDLRIKAIVDDGERSVKVVFDAEATEAVSGVSMDEAQTLAMDALDTSVVLDELTARVLGRPYQLTGPVVGESLLVNEVVAGPSDRDLSDDAVEPALTTRQPARRMLAQEINATTHTFQESAEERTPVLGLSPTGEAVNRVLVVGALTEVRNVGSTGEYWQGRVYAGSEPVFVYAGQYQPEAMKLLKEASTPSFVAIVGKLRPYETRRRINVAIEPESIAFVDGETRDEWFSEAVEHTQDRIASFDAGFEMAETARELYGDEIEDIRRAVSAAAADRDSEEMESSRCTDVKPTP
jgi:RPA family protein